MSRAGSERRVAMVYPGSGHAPTRRRATDYGHPAHRGFARAIGAEPVVVGIPALPRPLNQRMVVDPLAALRARSSVPEFDTFVLENDTVLYLAPFLRRRYPDATIVHLAAADRLLEATSVRFPDESYRRALVKRANAELDTAVLQRFLRRYCDGAVAVSRYAAERIRSFASLPVAVAEPYVDPYLYRSLPSVEPALDSTVAVTVGTRRDHKGVDLLVRAWPRVRERHPDAELRIVGSGYPREYADTVGVTLAGFVETVEPELARGALYVHPAYAEAFGVSVVEAMRAGLPPVVTGTTGAASAAREVDESLVVDRTPKALADAVGHYFSLSVERREALSAASRAASDPFDETTKTEAFVEAFRSVV